MLKIWDDEPSLNDRLGREDYVKAIAELAATCDTPLVIGVFGSWGTGKTSLMMQVQQELASRPTIGQVWFDPWLHQYDENPAIALVQETLLQLNLERTENVKNLLRVLGRGLFDTVAGKLGIPDSSKLREYKDAIEAERFREQEERTKLRQLFTDFIDNGKGDVGGRLIFFIDDLDRCSPDRVVSLLEALKLYLAVEDCVFLLGVDRGVVDMAVKEKYPWLTEGHVQYLDKIIQLPFRLPPISGRWREEYASHLINSLRIGEDSEKEVVDILVAGVGSNPRQAKRFANSFSLAHFICRSVIEDYNPEILALLQVVQYASPKLYEALARFPQRFVELWPGHDEDGQGTEDSLYDLYVAGNPELAKLLSRWLTVPETDIMPYVQLAGVTVAAQVSDTRTLEAILDDHAEWVRSDGSLGIRAELRNAELSESDFIGANLGGAAFSGSNLRSAKLRTSFLRDADLKNTTLDHADLSNATADGVDLTDARANEAILERAIMRKATMVNFQAPDSDLRGADLSGANLANAILRGSHLAEAILQSSVLDTADLSGAVLVDANLRSADLRRADLTNSILSGTNMSDAKTTGMQVRGARYDARTRWPSGFDPDEGGAILIQ